VMRHNQVAPLGHGFSYDFFGDVQRDQDPCDFR